jgi:hypothetical protein
MPSNTDGECQQEYAGTRNELPSIGDLEAPIQPQESDLYILYTRYDRSTIYRHIGQQWECQISWNEQGTNALMAPM